MLPQRTARSISGDDCVASTLMTDVHLMYPKMHVYGFNMTGEIGLLKKLSERLFHGVGYRLEAALIVVGRAAPASPMARRISLETMS